MIQYIPHTEEEENKDYYDYFDVQGAGKLKISYTSCSRTGTANGFSIGVEWGMHGFAGGVIDKKEAIRLAKHILRNTNLDELGI